MPWGHTDVCAGVELTTGIRKCRPASRIRLNLPNLRHSSVWAGKMVRTTARLGVVPSGAHCWPGTCYKHIWSVISCPQYAQAQREASAWALASAAVAQCVPLNHIGRLFRHHPARNPQPSKQCVVSWVRDISTVHDPLPQAATAWKPGT